MHNEKVKLIADIFMLASDVTITGKPDVFVSWAGHVGWLCLRIYPNGWAENGDPNDQFRMLTTEDELRSVHNFLLGLLPKGAEQQNFSKVIGKAAVQVVNANQRYGTNTHMDYSGHVQAISVHTTPHPYTLNDDIVPYCNIATTESMLTVALDKLQESFDEAKTNS